jgi:hypothetical protein
VEFAVITKENDKIVYKIFSPPEIEDLLKKYNPPAAPGSTEST